MSNRSGQVAMEHNTNLKTKTMKTKLYTIATEISLWAVTIAAMITMFHLFANFENLRNNANNNQKTVQAANIQPGHIPTEIRPLHRNALL